MILEAVTDQDIGFSSANMFSILIEEEGILIQAALTSVGYRVLRSIHHITRIKSVTEGNI